MSHEIDMSTGKPAIAWTNKAPWHQLGKKLEPGQSMDVWAKEAGLDYQVLRSPVVYMNNATLLQQEMAGRDVLYRSDTGAALSVVGKGYHIVQPAEILDVFARLSEIGGFELEVAGALSDGKRVWGLAKVNDGGAVIGHDVVRPYVLFATSYDLSMATIAKLSAIRVVCSNTITMALGLGIESAGKTESDTEGRAVSSLVRIPHCNKIDVDDIRMRLGIVADVYERWLVQTRIMAEQEMSHNVAESFVYNLIGAMTRAPSPGRKLPDIKDTKSFKRIMELFNGDLIGADLTGGQNRWRMINSVSEYVDHERGKSSDGRLSGAWFGAGDALKTKAYSMLTCGE